MRCCQSNEAVVEGPHHRRRRRKSTPALSGDLDDDEISHIIEVIDIRPAMNNSFAKLIQDNKDNQGDNQEEAAIDGDEISEVTFGTFRKDSSVHSSTPYNLSPDEIANTPKSKNNQDRDENKEATRTNNSEETKFDLPQSMTRVREEDEYSA